MEEVSIKIRKFTDLKVWKEAHVFVIEIYKITKEFPSEEKFGLISQMRRCAVSITSNIAEGFGRNTAKDKVRFYSIAKGSLFELQSQLYIAKDLDFIKEDYVNSSEEKIELISKLISGLIKSAMDKA
ncbi:four helix bundle protein [bacterium]|nr:four helix bundle protein [bacterium]MBT3730039.1 four helix bundle protein [bacterium]